MQRAEVNVEVCHVEEQDKGKSTAKRQTKGKKRSSKKTRATRKKPKLVVDSDVETTESVISGWEDDDELDASQYHQGDDQGRIQVRKRSVEDTVRGTELGNKPTAKRRRTSVHEAD